MHWANAHLEGKYYYICASCLLGIFPVIAYVSVHVHSLLCWLASFLSIRWLLLSTCMIACTMLDEKHLLHPAVTKSLFLHVCHIHSAFKQLSMILRHIYAVNFLLRACTAFHIQPLLAVNCGHAMYCCLLLSLARFLYWWENWSKRYLCCCGQLLAVPASFSESPLPTTQVFVKFFWAQSNVW